MKNQVRTGEAAPIPQGHRKRNAYLESLGLIGWSYDRAIRR
jgi:hypothetical protein